MRYNLLHIHFDETNKEEVDYYESNKYSKKYHTNKTNFEQEFGQIYLTFLTLELDLDEFLEAVNGGYNRVKVIGQKIKDFERANKIVKEITSEENYLYLLQHLNNFREFRNELSHSAIYYHLMEDFFFLFPNDKRVNLYPKDNIAILENKKILKLNENYFNHIAFFSVNFGIDKKRKRDITLFSREKTRNKLYGISDLKALIVEKSEEQEL